MSFNLSAKQRNPIPYSFEGQAHQRPSQSYAGYDAKKNRDELLRHLEEERRRRERSRQCEAASTKLQSAWRGTKVRDARQQNLAKIYHDLIEKLKNTNAGCDLNTADMLIRCMVFSRKDNLLEDDIQWFAGQILKNVQSFLPILVPVDSKGKPIMYRLKAFLMQILTRLCFSSRPTTALRLLELLLNQGTYSALKSNNEGTAKDAAKQAVQHLINHKFYATLCQTLVSKADANLELLPGQGFPGGFSGAILQLMLLPVRTVHSDELLSLVTKHLVFDVLCRPEPVIGRFIIPALLQSEVADRLATIISKCLLENKHKTSQIQPIASVHVIWCILSALKKTDHQVLPASSANLLVECLALLLRQMPASDLQTEDRVPMNVDKADSDDDSDEETAHHVSQLVQYDFGMSSSIWASLDSYAKQMHSDVISMICNDRSFAQLLRQVVDASKGTALTNADDGTCQIAQLFYELIYRHGVTPSKMRGSSLPVFDKDLLRRFYFKMACLVGPISYPVQITLVQRVQSGHPLHQSEYELLVPVFTIFTKFFHWLLLCVNDAEFLDDSLDRRVLIPFVTSELIEITSNFRRVCAGLVDVLSPSRFLGPSMKLEALVTSPKAYIPMFRSACHLLKHLYSRNCRLNFLPEGFWSSVLSSVQPIHPPPFGLISYLVQPFEDSDMLLTGEYLQQGLDPTVARALTANEVHLAIVLTNVPFLLPFEYRYDVFRAVLNRDREANSRSRPMGLDDGLTIDIRVRRQYLYEDAFEKLSLENAPNMKKRIRCQLINFTGLDEAGIDGGGLFREFLTELIRTAFDPNRGLFCFTPTAKQDGRLYPNPAAESLYPDNWKMHFFFLGRIVGKLLYEKLLVELPMADFFLAKILSRDFASLDVHHLADLDPVLYKNLLFLKTYTGNVEDLGLDFTIVDDSQISENPRVIELIPNGKNTPVSAENRIQYTHLVADYKLNRRISAQCKAFVDGLSHVVSLDWLRMFSPPELQTLISGAEKPISVADLMANTKYTGAYNEEHPTIQVFWNVVRHRLSEDQRRKLLKFVTSCSRPPMFGFKDLEPPFTIHSSGPPDQNGPVSGGLRLPSASTCINLLKLPEYTNEDTMLERLLYAIESQSGFELS